MKTFVIAEMGSCHDGSWEKAAKLVRVAHQSGADAVKAQYWSDPDALADRRKVPPEYRELYRRYQIPAEWVYKLRLETLRLGLEFLCTTYLPQDVAEIASFVTRFKVASFEAGDLEFVQEHLKHPWPHDVIISTGMQDLGTVRALEELDHKRIKLLHCVSAYPAPWKDLNLSTLWTGHYHGFSDHSGRVDTGAYAVAAGAEIIEVHFKLWGTNPLNPDAPHALNPIALTEYIGRIRQVERMLGDGEKRPMSSEEEMLKYKVFTP